MTDVEQMIKDKKNILYEDDKVVALMPEDAMSIGHIKVCTKEPVGDIEEIDEETFQHLFYVASYSATCLFEYLGAQGTNIICNTGDLFGKRFVIDVVARKQDDGLNFTWEPKKIEEDEMDEAAKRIKDKADLIGHDAPGPIEEQEAKKIDSKDNYQVKQLNRIP